MEESIVDIRFKKRQLLLSIFIFFKYLYPVEVDHSGDPWFTMDLISPTPGHQEPKEYISVNIPNIEQKLKKDFPFDYVDMVFNFPGYGRDNAIEFEIEGKKGLLDFNGNILIMPYAEKLGKYSEGMVSYYEGNCHYNGKSKILKNCRVGFLSKKGVAIPATYEKAEPFSKGRAVVFINDKWNFIDKSGKIQINLNKEEADYLNNFEKYKKIERINESNTLIPAKQEIEQQRLFTEDGIIKKFKENNTGMKGDDRYGAIRNGKTIIETICLDLINYKGNYICWDPDLLSNPDFIVYDKYGKKIFDSKSNLKIYKGDPEKFESYLRINIEKKQTYVNKKGEYRADKIFDRISGYKNNVAVVKQGNKFGIIKRNGEFLKIKE